MNLIVIVAQVYSWHKYQIYLHIQMEYDSFAKRKTKGCVFQNILEKSTVQKQCSAQSTIVFT